MYTFEEWRATGRATQALTEDEGDTYAGRPGRVYSPAGFLVETEDGWIVPLPHGEFTQWGLEEAEIYLWGEHVDGLLNA